jgi:hypothetical protein
MTAEDAIKAGAAPSAKWFEAEKAITLGGWRNVQELAEPGYTMQVGGQAMSASWMFRFCP